MADNFQVNVTADKATYNPGDTITLTLTGSDVVTSTVTENATISGKLVAADGASGNFGPITIALTKNVTENDSVKFQSITDSTGLVWTVAADGLHATAVVPA